MTRAAYFDCFSGCSGDMIIGALLDAGLDFTALEQGLAGLDLHGYQLSTEKVTRSSITATKFNVVTERNHEHAHGHTHDELHHHRGLTDITDIITRSSIPEGVKAKSIAMFRKLGAVEAGIHGVPLEEVHFHELGAVDTIIDIVGTLLALDAMQIATAYASPLAVGNGTVKTAHGVLPVPAPATLQLLADAGAPLADAPATDTPCGELLTPTGAVLITSLAAAYRRPNLKMATVGYGAGDKQFPGWPNVVRVWVGEEPAVPGETGMVLLETNIDDMSPETHGYVMETLFENGAADVWFTPIQMKKNRPAVMLSVVCSGNIEATLTDIIMRETTTLGIRSRPIARHIARREIIEVETSLGKARVKAKRFGEHFTLYPEYEDCRRIARDRGLTLQETSRIIATEAREYLQSHPQT